jgi:methylenetetrahydrofolate reductase (NADPH)
MGGLDPVTQAAGELLKGYSAEVTTPDRKSLDVAAGMMPKKAPVYIASLPKDTSDGQLAVACHLRDLDLRPVPHIVARNIEDRQSLEAMVKAFAVKAGVNRALILGGDRAVPAGEYDSALQLIKSGVLEDNGIDKIAIGCYPEGHPNISDDVLRRALFEKLEAADKGGFDVRLISQLCFSGSAISAYVKSLRDAGVTAKIRIGLAGPASTRILLKYAAICGVGPSLRLLRKQQSMAKGLMQNNTPEDLLLEIAACVVEDPSLAITGVHFFTFASLNSTIVWANEWLVTHNRRLAS